MNYGHTSSPPFSPLRRDSFLRAFSNFLRFSFALFSPLDQFVTPYNVYFRTSNYVREHLCVRWWVNEIMWRCPMVILAVTFRIFIFVRFVIVAYINRYVFVCRRYVTESRSNLRCFIFNRKLYAYYLLRASFICILYGKLIDFLVSSLLNII